jgi:hypothetical protein
MPRKVENVVGQGLADWLSWKTWEQKHTEVRCKDVFVIVAILKMFHFPTSKVSIQEVAVVGHRKLIEHTDCVKQGYTEYIKIWLSVAIINIVMLIKIMAVEG